MKLHWVTDDRRTLEAEVDDDCYPESVHIHAPAPCDDRRRITTIDLEAWRYQCGNSSEWFELPAKFAMADGSEMIHVYTPGTIAGYRGTPAVKAPG